MIWALARSDIACSRSRLEVLILNLYNILLSQLLCLALYLLSARYASSLRVRAIFVLACMYGTYLWYYQRTQGWEIYLPLFFCLAFYFPHEAFRYGQNITAAGVLGVYHSAGLQSDIFWCADSRRYRRRRVCHAAKIIAGAKAHPPARPPLVILALLGWINNLKFGSPWLTGYHQWRPQDHTLSGSWREGIYGLLFSFALEHIPLLSRPDLRALLLEAVLRTSQSKVDAWVIIAFFTITAACPGQNPQLEARRMDLRPAAT